MNAMRASAAVLALAFVLVSAKAASAIPRPPELDPANFGSDIDNPFFPLVPGTTFFYEGLTEGVPTTNVVTVTHDTKTILGVVATVVHDQVYEDGVLTEDTFDWYAQDLDGNVWYLGEDSRELDAGGNVISTEGSWEAGVDGALAGIVMEADPRVGDHYRQEFARDVAEDSASVIDLDGSVCVELGCFDNLLVTKEVTRLEPGVVEQKSYAAGVGFVYGEMTKGGSETLELVSVTTGG